MLRRLLPLGLLLSLVLCSTAAATTYFVNPSSGSNSNSGTSIGSPWKTLGKIKSTAVAGDIVNVIGGTYTQTQWAGDLSLAARIWAEDDHAGSAGNPIIIQSNPGSTAIIDGEATADSSIAFVPHAGYSPVTDRYVVIRNMEFRHFRSTAIYTQAANHVAIVNCYIHDLYDATSGAFSTEASSYIIWQGNRFYNLGDISLGWGGSVGAGDHGMYISDDSHFVVSSGNTAERVPGFGVHAWNNHGSANTSNNIIVRQNVLINNASSGIIAAGLTYDKVYIYNNTVYADPVPMPEIYDVNADDAITFHNGGSYSRVRVFNNIGYGTWNRAAFSQDNSAQFTSLVLNNNFWTNIPDATSVVKWDGVWYTLAGYQSATGQDSGAKTGNPLFTNISSRDFTLQAGSPAIDAGRTLTTATNSGSSSTSLAVADAGFFHDGYGLIAGDSIRIGTTALVAVTSVNYSTNTLTLAAPRSWSAGAAVSLDYQGSAPDMGAAEGGTGTPPPTPSVGTFYLSPSGNDANDCDTAKLGMSSAKQTFASLLPCVAGGSTILLASGTYTEALHSTALPLLGGTSWATATTITNYLGSSPVLAPPGLGGLHVVRLLDSANSYFVFSNLTIQGLGTSGGGFHIETPAHHVRVSNVTMTGLFTQSAVRFKGASGSELLSSSIANVTLTGVLVDNSAADVLVQGTTIFDYGVNGIATTTGTTGIFTRNTIRNAKAGNTWAAIALIGGADNLATNNLLWQNNIGILVQGGTNQRAWNNTVYLHSGAGLQVDSGVIGATLGNNILWQNSAPVNNAGTGTNLPTNLTTDPLFVNAAAFNLHVQAGSPAIDTGTATPLVTIDADGAPRPQGQIDIGAYETTGAPPPVGAPAQMPPWGRSGLLLFH